MTSLKQQAPTMAPELIAEYRYLSEELDRLILAGKRHSEVMALRRDLVAKTHGGHFGCAPTWDKFVEATRAPNGQSPHWGQAGRFITHAGGICFGIDYQPCAWSYWSLFAFAVGGGEFISETGFRNMSSLCPARQTVLEAVDELLKAIVAAARRPGKKGDDGWALYRPETIYILPASGPFKEAKEETMSKQAKHGLGWIDAKTPPPSGRIYNLGGDEGHVQFLSLDRPTRDAPWTVDAKFVDNGEPLINGESENPFMVSEWNANWGDDPDVTFTDAEVPAAGLLFWSEEGGLLVAASVAYGSTEGGLYWRIRPMGKRFSIDGSDKELLSGVPKAKMGPYPTIADAKRVAQDLDAAARASNASSERPLTFAAMEAVAQNELVRRAIDHVRDSGKCSVSELQTAMGITRALACELFDHLVDEHYITGSPGKDICTAAMILKEPPSQAAVRQGTCRTPSLQSYGLCPDHVMAGGKCGADGDDCDGCNDKNRRRLPSAASAAPASPAPLPATTTADHLPPARHVELPPDKIAIIPGRNDRQHFDAAKLTLLGESMRDLDQLQEIIVNQAAGGGYELVTGERRLRAAIAAGIELIQCKVYKTLTPMQVALAADAENARRADLNHVENAHRYKRYADAGMSVAGIAALTGESDDTVRRHLALLRLTPPVAALVATGRLPVHQAELIARVGDPVRQISLAEKCLALGYNAKKASWTHKPDWGYKDGDPTDFLMPMEDLRKEVAYAMCGLASCGWLKLEDRASKGDVIEETPISHAGGIAGMRACAGCPDNTSTYADQPTLFAGIRPQGAATKGYCTNRPCYEAKGKVWDKVLAQRHKAEEKAKTSAIAKARRAGLDVCEACGKVADAGDKFAACKEAAGQKVCSACAKKAKDRRATGGSSAPQRAPKKRPFPQSPAERSAVDLSEYGEKLLHAINDHIKQATKNGEWRNDFAAWGSALLVASQPANGGTWCDFDLKCVKDPDAEALFSGMLAMGDDTDPGFPEVVAIEMWKCVDMQDFSPVMTYQGEVENVPLPRRAVLMIDVLEMLARRWGIVFEVQRPTPAEETAVVEEAKNATTKDTKRAKGKAAKQADEPAEDDADVEGDEDGEE